MGKVTQIGKKLSPVDRLIAELKLPGIRTAVLMIRRADGTVDICGAGGDAEGHDLLVIQRTLSRFIDENLEESHSEG